MVAYNKILLKVRSELEFFRDNKAKFIIQDDMACGCAIGATMIWATLKCLGQDVDVVSGTYKRSDHAWCESPKRILDVTATQFGLGFIVVAPKPDKDYYAKSRGIDAFNDFVSWDEQSPQRWGSEIFDSVKRILDVQVINPKTFEYFPGVRIL